MADGAGAGTLPPVNWGYADSLGNLWWLVSGAAYRRYLFAGFIVLVILFIALLYFFEDKPDILIPALTGLGGLVSGFLGGFGFGKHSGT